MAAPAYRVLEGNARRYAQTWRGSVITTFVNPVLYLAAMGVGLGSLIDAGAGEAVLGGVGYLAFLAPGLMAATAMQTGVGDSTYPVMAGIKWVRSYDAVLATPVRVGDLVTGHLGWVAVRLLLTATAFAAVSAAFGAVSWGGAALAVAPAVLTGIAFAAPVTAYTATLDSEYGLSSLFRFGVVPMFLFSGTFFPVTQLPGWVQPVAVATPLWHGVQLCRHAALGITAEWPVWAHAGYLALWAAVGGALAVRLLTRRMVR